MHLAQEAWTNKVDTKGSILLALQGGALFAIFSASGSNGVLADLNGWRQLVASLGTAALLLAMVTAVLAIFPRLGSARQHREQHRDHIIYFGHLRHWSPSELHTRMQRLSVDDELAALAGQLVRAGRTNWIKYRLVQLSLLLAVVGILAVSSAALLR